MRLRLILVTLFVALTTMGSSCLNDPLIVAVNLDPIEACWPVNVPGTFNDSTRIPSIQDYVPSSYRDNLRGLRVYDITVHVHDAPAAGNVNGSIFFRFEGQSAYKLLDFSGSYSDFAAGISVLNSGGHLVINPAGMNALLAAISNPGSLPAIVLRGQGGASGPSSTFDVCCVVKLQASAEVD